MAHRFVPFRVIFCLVAVLTMCALTASAAVPAAPTTTTPALSRHAQLVEANIIAVDAYQVLLARESGKGSETCYPRIAPDKAALEALVAHQKSLLAEPSEQVVAWADGKPSAFHPEKDLYPLLHSGLSLSADLPVNVFTRYLQQQVPSKPLEDIRAVANLYQTDLELERDGDLLQDLYHFYIPLHLPVYVGQLGLPGTDADFLKAAQQLAGKSCASPFDLSVPAWQIAGRKIWNWGEKNLHIRDADTVAAEMLAEPQIAALIPQMKSMKPKKIAVIGDSYTMDVHWASPSSFTRIVAAMFARENPKVEFRQWSHGGLKYSRAYKNDYQSALAWKPDVILFAGECNSQADIDAMTTMMRGFRAAGSQVMQFDDVEEPEGNHPMTAKALVESRQLGTTIIPSKAALDAAPDRASFLAMDGEHKTEPYHRLMATLWLRAILTASK